MKKHHIGIGVAIAAMLAAMVFFYFRAQDEGFAWSQFLLALRLVRWNWLLLSVPAILAAYLVRAVRWEVLLRPICEAPNLRRITAATCIGFTAVVLFGRAGEAVRPFLIARWEKVTISSQIAAWVVERILDTLMVLLIFGVALTQVENSGLAPGPNIRVLIEVGGWLAGVTGGACLALLIGLRMFKGSVRDRLLDSLAFMPQAAVERVRGFLQAFEAGMQSTRERWFVWLLILYTILEWATVTAAFWCVFRAFPALDVLGITDVIIMLGFVSFGSVLQVPGVGGGVQIVTVLVLTELYGVGLEAASGFALILWAIAFLVVVPVGLMMAFHEGIKWRNMRHVGDEGLSLDPDRLQERLPERPEEG